MTTPSIADTPLLLSSLPAPLSGPWSPAASTSRAVGVIADTTLTPSERRRWQTIVAVTTLFILPMLMDAVVVLALQGDRGTNAWDIPTLQRLLPLLPAGITTVVAAVLPTTLLVCRRQIDQRVIGRFTWLSLTPIMLTTGLFGALWLWAPGDANAHLWGFSFGVEVIDILRGDNVNSDAFFYAVGSCVGLVLHALRSLMILVIAAGLRRLVGPGAWRTAIGALVVADLLVWVASTLLGSPAAMRAVADIVLAIFLVLVAVCSQPAFEDERA